MHLCKYRSGNFVVFSIDEPVQLETDLSELRDHIEKSVNTECVNIAIRFPQESMLTSSSVADLVLSAGYAHSCGGTFALIEPNNGIRRALKALGVGSLVLIVESEADLLAYRPRAAFAA
jgi:hypothetical protein